MASGARSFEMVASYRDAEGRQTYTIEVEGARFDVVQISAGWLHTCAVATNGSAWCWGINNAGQLGNGTQTTSAKPVPVSGLQSGVSRIVAARYHTCAIQNGAAKCWGLNSSTGIPGNGVTGSSVSYTPTTVTGLETGVTHLSTSNTHSCAVRSGGAYCWGSGSWGALGNGSTASKPAAVAVSGLSSGVTDIKVGIWFSCAIHSGVMKCWGYNQHGELGDGSVLNKTTPSLVQGMSGVSHISTGSQHACAIKEGTAYCWGNRSNGALGDGECTNCTANRTTPFPVVGLSSGVTSISAGDSFTCAAHNGAAKCWGLGTGGRLGLADGPAYSSFSTPRQVSGLSSGVSVLSDALYTHMCALHDGAAKCWGYDGYGQLGRGVITAVSDRPDNVLPP